MVYILPAMQSVSRRPIAAALGFLSNPPGCSETYTSIEYCTAIYKYKHIYIPSFDIHKCSTHSIT